MKIKLLFFLFVCTLLAIFYRPFSNKTDSQEPSQPSPRPLEKPTAPAVTVPKKIKLPDASPPAKPASLEQELTQLTLSKLPAPFANRAKPILAAMIHDRISLTWSLDGYYVRFSDERWFYDRAHANWTLEQASDWKTLQNLPPPFPKVQRALIEELLKKEFHQKKINAKFLATQDPLWISESNHTLVPVVPVDIEVIPERGSPLREKWEIDLAKMEVRSRASSSKHGDLNHLGIDLKK